MELTEEGIIKAINTTHPTKKKVTPIHENHPGKRLDPRNFMTEEMLMAGSTNKMAELIAKEIYNIRESKNSLTRGQADYMPQDGAALKIMLSNLEEQEKALTEMFSGYTERSQKTFTFHVVPEQEITNQVVCRFSQKLGILRENDLAGEPIYLTVTNESALPPANETAKAKKKLDGVIYNIPGKGRVSIDSMDKNYFEDELLITQFGETEVLIDDLFNKKSGLLGISGVSSDDRDVLAAERAGNPRAKLAHEMLCYQIKKFIGSYSAALNGVDAIVFTAGLGEHQWMHREAIMQDMEYLGVELDKEANLKAVGVEGKISTENSKVAVYVIPTNEELVIARDTKALVEKL